MYGLNGSSGTGTFPPMPLPPVPAPPAPLPPIALPPVLAPLVPVPPFPEPAVPPPPEVPPSPDAPFVRPLGFPPSPPQAETATAKERDPKYAMDRGRGMAGHRSLFVGGSQRELSGAKPSYANRNFEDPQSA